MTSEDRSFISMSPSAVSAFFFIKTHPLKTSISFKKSNTAENWNEGHYRDRACMCLCMWFYKTLIYSLHILLSCQLASHLLYTFSSGLWCWAAKWWMSWWPGVKSTADPRGRGEGVDTICVLSWLVNSFYAYVRNPFVCRFCACI